MTLWRWFWGLTLPRRDLCPEIIPVWNSYDSIPLLRAVSEEGFVDTGMLRRSQTEHDPGQDQEENRNSCWGGRRGRIKGKKKRVKGRQREQRRRREKERRKERRRDRGKGWMSKSCLGLESSTGLFPGSLVRAYGKGVQADRR